MLSKSFSKINHARNFFRAFFIFSCIAILSSGCQQNEPKVSNLSPEQQALIEKGKTVYMTYCIVCHNMNPSLAGSTGPEVTGSSLELLEARIMRAEYPAGYKPKRDTKLMVEIEDLKADIPAIHAFLNQ